MADEGALTVILEVGEPEQVWCGDEAMWRIPILIDGKEIGDYIGASEELADE